MIALVHDVLVTVGALMLANYEFDLTVVAALLTIVGFSVNDTVVICDRIRENLRKIQAREFGEYHQHQHQRNLEPDDSYHGHGFAGLAGALPSRRRCYPAVRFRLLVGFISGVYSTIFIASPVILLWDKSFKK